MKLVAYICLFYFYWVGCYIWYSNEGTGRGRSPPRPQAKCISPPINGQWVISLLNQSFTETKETKTKGSTLVSVPSSD